MDICPSLPQLCPRYSFGRLLTPAAQNEKYELAKMRPDLKPMLEAVALFGLKYSDADEMFLLYVKKTMNL